jgi:HK97 family phage prohead protease
VTGLEVRLAPAPRMECRTENGTITFSGVASSVNSPYDMGAYTELVRAGAFTKTLARNPDVMLLVEHSGLPLARTVNGSLTLTETARGLEFHATASADDPDAAQIARKLKAGLVGEASFAFRVTEQKWDATRENREILEVDLHRGDVSICALGANSNTSSMARALARRPRRRLSIHQARARALRLRGKARA